MKYIFPLQQAFLVKPIHIFFYEIKKNTKLLKIFILDHFFELLMLQLIIETHNKQPLKLLYHLINFCVALYNLLSDTFGKHFYL